MADMSGKIIKGFIVLEGLDGAGTSTQLSLIGSRFRGLNIPCRATFEPTDSPIGTLIRNVLSMNISMHPASLAHLYVSDRHEHLYGRGGIIEQIEEGKLVICDRYIFSSLAYQSVDCGVDYVGSINAIFPLPELVLFIDLDPEICQQRLADRGKVELFDDLRFQQQVRQGYRSAFSAFQGTGMTVEFLDGTLPADLLLEKIWEIFQKLSILTV
jgi:dTMP kinase